MTLGYDEASLAGGMDEANLALYLWDEGAGDWLGVASELDVEANRLVSSLDRAAIFGMLGRIETGARVHLPIILKDD